MGLGITITRGERQTISIGETIKVSVISINVRDREVTLAIQAPRELKVWRGHNLPQRQGPAMPIPPRPDRHDPNNPDSP